MDPTKFNLNLLAVFDAIRAEGTVTKAADRLKISQSAVSHALNRLRAVTGDELFERTGHGMRPTARAEEIAPRIVHALELARSALTAAAPFEPATAQRNFTIELPAGLDTLIAPRLSQSITGTPGIDIQIYNGRASQAANSLRAGETCIALDYEPLRQDSYHSQLLYEDRMVAVARRGHPEITRAMTLDLYQSVGHVAVIWDRNSPANPLIAHLRSKGISRRVRLNVANMHTMLRIVSISDLVGSTWSNIATAAKSDFDIEVHDLPFAMSAMNIYMVWHDRFASDPGHRWLRDQLTAIGRSLTEWSAPSPGESHEPGRSPATGGIAGAVAAE